MIIFILAGLVFPSNLLAIDKDELSEKLTTRLIKTVSEEIMAKNNVSQAEATRDSLAKGLYSRYVVKYVVLRNLKSCERTYQMNVRNKISQHEKCNCSGVNNKCSVFPHFEIKKWRSLPLYFEQLLQGGTEWRVGKCSQQED